MDRLWSPWRMAYVTSGDRSTGCIFCDVSGPGSEELVLARGRSVYAILNLYPYNSGHLMIVPFRHVAALAATTSDEQVELMRFARLAEMALTEAYSPQGINVGINLGRCAGAGIADHLHIHLVPRWTGDTNFMSVVGETRVLPEELWATKQKLQPIFERLQRVG